MTATIVARCSVAGLHHWPGAPARRAYLRSPHRHLFGVEVEVEVLDQDREVEFHDLGELAVHLFKRSGGPYHPEADVVDFGAKSCEVLAAELVSRLRTYGFVVERVVVSEDGENDGVWTSR